MATDAMQERPLAELIRCLRDLVALAIASGSAAGLSGLDRRLRVLLDEPISSSTKRARLLAEIEKERGTWEGVLREALLPEVRAELARVLETLRLDAGLSAVPDPWASLDDVVREANERARRSTITLTQYAVVSSCQRFVSTRKATDIRDAVRHVEEAVKVVSDSESFPVTELTSQQEADCLHEGLHRVLGESASSFLIAAVRDYIDRTNRPVPRQLSRHKSQAAPDDHWFTREEWKYHQPWLDWEEGIRFVPEIQAQYDESLHKARRVYEASVWKEVGDRSRGDEHQKVEESDPAGPPDPSLSPARVDRLEEPAEETSSEAEVTVVSPGDGIETDGRFVIHFVEDGFTALGRVWARGMQLTLDRNSPGWEVTMGLDGRSSFDMTEKEQLRRFGKVYFRTGPWPGRPLGVATLSPTGVVERSSDQKEYSIERSRESW